MALSYISAAGMGTATGGTATLGYEPYVTSGDVTSGANCTAQSSIVRPGSSGWAYRFGGPACSVQFRVRASGTGSTAFGTPFFSHVFYLYITTLPDVSAWLMMQAGGAAILKINSTGTLSTNGNGGTTGTSSQTLSADGLWHQIVWDFGATTTDVYVDGILWASSTGASNTPSANCTLGDAGGGASVVDFCISDWRAYDATLSGVIPKTYYQKLLLPTAGNNANSWTDGAGGTGAIFGSVDNIPPVGVAASTASAKIKNAANGGNLDYTATMQTYTAAGIPAGSTINAIAAICNDGEELSIATKAGAIWCASNPAQSAPSAGARGSFDYGDDTATVVGTYPTGWATHLGVVTENPSVTLGTAPTVTVRKISSTTRVVDVDFMGLYVDYTPPPIARVVGAQQAVKRANFF